MVYQFSLGIRTWLRRQKAIKNNSHQYFPLPFPIYGFLLLTPAQIPKWAVDYNLAQGTITPKANAPGGGMNTPRAWHHPEWTGQRDSIIAYVARSPLGGDGLFLWPGWP